MVSSKDNNLDAGYDDVQRFAELGRLSASLLHEISNPLTAALVHLEQAGDQTSNDLRRLKRNLTRLARYVNAARGQLKDQSMHSSFYVDTQLSDVKRLVLPLAKCSFVKLDFSKAPHLRLHGDPVQFQQILVNLIVNAIEAYPDATKKNGARRVLVEISLVSDHLIIKVSDQGEGIERQQLPKLFDPFYTTKGTSGHGLGLGLVIVKRYVRDGFNGSIRVTSSAIKGTCFSIKLPI